MKITTIDRATIRALRTEIEAALEDAGIEGVTFRVGNASFNPGHNVTFKLEVAMIQGDGSVASQEAEAWRTYAPLHNLPEDGVGKTVTLNGKRCKIIGFAPRSHKYPVLAEVMGTGKVYKFQVSTVQRAFGVKATTVY